MSRIRSFAVFAALTALSLTACKKGAGDGGAPSASASAAQAPKPANDTLTFTVVAPKVGDKREEKETSELDMKLDMEILGRKKSGTMHETETTVRRDEVLAVDGKTITKAKVTFVEKKKVVMEDGKEKKKPKSPIDGKTYVLEQKGDKVEITDEKGKKANRAEDEAVRKVTKSFGKPDPILASLPDKPIKVGDSVESMAKAFEDMLMSKSEGKDAPKVSDVAIKLESIEGQGADAVGVFSLALTLSTAGGPKALFATKALLKGTFKVRAKDGWSTALDLAGPMTLTSEDPKFKIDSKGDLKLTLAITY